MSSRRWLLAVVGMSAVLHLIGMARSPLPAQDGLKFLRVAREFHARPWTDVVRDSDQHPLYPALVALAEPALSPILGRGSDAWRVAAQGVSMLASLLLLWPLHAMTRRMFDERTANLAVFLYALLPFPAAIGHETLSDALALAFTVGALCLGEATFRTRSWRAAIGCGALAGLGFWTRPEVALVPCAVVIASMWRRRTWREELAFFGRVAALSATVGLFVGSYAFIKGEVSDKLAFRLLTGVGADAHSRAHRPPTLLPKGLDDPRFDFSPKEESETLTLRDRPAEASRRLLQGWAEGYSPLLIPVFLWGVFRSRKLGGTVEGRRILLVYVVAFAAIVVRHAVTLGYLSGRHALPLVVATIPWASAGIWAWLSGFPARRGLSESRGRRLGYAGLVGLLVLGATVQVKAGHVSRWGHRAAGLWLAGRAEPGDAVLDTRGWAAFVSGMTGYDYWHVRQALSDRHLKYVVVGSDELAAKSGRAATLRAMLAYAGRPVAAFPGRSDGRGVGVEVYRFDPPGSWEGVRP